MSKFTDLFTTKKNAELYSVEYKYFGDISSNFDLYYDDNISVLETSTEKLRVLVSRKIVFKPQTLFSISVSYFIDHFLKRTVIGKINWEDYNVQKELDENHDFFSGRELDRVSLLISQVTGSFGNSPLITPPLFETPNEVEKAPKIAEQ